LTDTYLPEVVVLAVAEVDVAVVVCEVVGAAFIGPGLI
jgi:hypothetical protein